jgi:hypothetical protein
LLLLPVLALAGCADDSSTAATTTSAAPSTTTTTEVIPVDTTFEAADVEQLCADLEGLASIDPDVEATQADVDRMRAIADTAPPGVAEPLRQVADFGQTIVDGAEPEDLPTDVVEAAVILISYGNEACGIDVPLFDTLAGV